MTHVACPIAFAPKIPTVTLLVDRSGSMFHCLSGNTGDAFCADITNTNWYKSKAAIESVLVQLDSQARFGFSTIWGTNPMAGGTCPSLQGMTTDALAPALNNAAAIMSLYDGLPLPPNSTQSGMRFEGPASASIAVAAKSLESDALPGAKGIIYVTDGLPDYCDDSNSLCAPDSVVYQLQTAYSAGIKTIVVGVQANLFDLAPGMLQAFANAGSGEPTLAPVKAGGSVNDFYDQCNSIGGWAADLVASGKPNARSSTIGTYATTMGPTMPYPPSSPDQIAAAISGLKHCTFDLGALNGKPIRIDRTQISSAHVCLSRNCPTGELPQDAANGWSMSSDTQLILNGTACAKWRLPGSSDISFGFPCESIVTD